MGQCFADLILLRYGHRIKKYLILRPLLLIISPQQVLLINHNTTAKLKHVSHQNLFELAQNYLTLTLGQIC